MDLYKEGLRRIWWPFWENITKNDQILKENIDSFRIEYSNSQDDQIHLGLYRNRILVQIQIAKENEESVRTSLDKISQDDIKVVHWIQENLEGPDVFWDGFVIGNQRTQSYFGNLQIEAFPFKIYIQYDENQEQCYIPKQNWLQLCERNLQRNIISKKLIRKKLKALCGQKVYYKHQKLMKIDKQLKIVQFYYGYLKINGRSSYDSRISKFNVTIDLIKGTIKNIEILSGNKKHEEIVCQLNHSDLEITNQFELTTQLNKLLNNKKNQKLWQDNLKTIQDDEQKQRIKKMSTRYFEEKVFSYSFLPLVFLNIGLPKRKLEQFFQNQDYEIYSKFYEVNRKGFDYIYCILDYFQQSPMNAQWYLFFEDLWYQNCQFSSEVQKHYHFLNPEYPSFLGYHMIPQEDLLLLLNAMNILKQLPSNIIENLYTKLNQLYYSQENFDYSDRILRFNKKQHSHPQEYFKLFDYRQDKQPGAESCLGTKQGSSPQAKKSVRHLKKSQRTSPKSPQKAPKSSTLGK